MDEKKGVHQAVEDSNIRFYKAFETLSIGKMGQVWKHSDDTICIHPGWEMFTSWTAIRESWLRIFENTKMIKFVITNIKIKVFQKIAIVVCLENIDSIIEDENSIRLGVIATNIFEKQNVNNKNNNEWLMVHHHGSSVANYMAPNVSV
ncbi:MAG: nuclear transport factor 2 family protein [Nitrososphaeraceae archaeon]|nr:nuclear transport factor 2 family protein [Nitrososphaeraceae archaeon]MDW0176796.1 nuclear transport factor 2 family protein [Nitrososphaeraceae archaeon]MDW0178685.1 nuclear transport factor 2 family protein [Nitrososphaeraceae archaeon]MDW0181379.1 nuclear transport factor 2 family protein [Nitrososphaeraceae archaeon]MDW0182927.1 nuclear transport factor 2 family protein [Nitrososphaeraceae archaeon]